MPLIYSKSNNQIIAGVGDPFVIELEGNATTGYEWQLQFDSDKIVLLDQQYKPVGSKLGAGGVQRFKLRASRPGQTTIRAAYKRSWEPNPNEEQMFGLHVRR